MTHYSKPLQHQRRSTISCCISLALLASGPLQGAEFMVTRSADDNDPGSLRSAVAQANTTPGADVIQFSEGLGTIVLGGSNLFITDALSIIGPVGRQAISGNHQSNIFDTDISVELVLQNLTLTDGYSNFSGGAVSARGDLTLRNCLVINNTTDSSFGRGGALATDSATIAVVVEQSLFQDNRTIGSSQSGGGAISSAGSLVVRESTLRHNQTNGFDSGGGAIRVGGSYFHLIDSIVEGNTTFGGRSGGAGILANTLDTRIVNSIVRDNTVVEGGGNSRGAGIRTSLPSAAGQMVIRESTISGNVMGPNATQQGGGGVYVRSQPVSIINSTISGNVSSAGSGGGLFVSRQPFTIENSTVVANAAGVNGSAIYSAFDSDQEHSIDSSIVTGNSTDSSGTTVATLGLLSVSNSVFSPKSPITGTDIGNLRNGDVNIGPLADNGCARPAGFPPQAICPPTHALLGNPWPGANPGAEPFDQRGEGFPRLVGGAIDAGAVEIDASLLFSSSFEEVRPPVIAPPDP